MTEQSTIVDFSCSICGRKVGYRELYPAGVARSAERGGEHPLRVLDLPWVYADDGDRSGNSELTPAEFERDRAALTGDRPEGFLKLYCEACGLVYCFNHWRMEYSDEPPVAVGFCPRGHAHIIDMG